MNKEYRGWTLTFENDRYTAKKGNLSASAATRADIERVIDALERENPPRVAVEAA